jgi:uncharacterized protein YkwD
MCSVPSRLFVAALLIVVLTSQSTAVFAQDPSVPAAVLRPVVYFPHVEYNRQAATSTPKSFEEQVVVLTNALRAGAGCPALNIAPVLMSTALAHSRDMAEHNLFSHTGSDGADLGQRLERAGYRPSEWAENIAYNFTSPESVVTAWRNSEGHSRNIFNCALTQIGVGYVYDATDNAHYWTQDFARP